MTTSSTAGATGGSQLLCLTLDTDPDGLNRPIPDRRSLEWEGLENVQRLPEELEAFAALGPLPITWFVRADGQLESNLGNSAYLLERYERFWGTVRNAGHEVAWHPHLYRQADPTDEVSIITDPSEARDELERLWGKLRTTLDSTSFRHGEGWHTPETYATVERLGFHCDSTAIPGRKGSFGHPMNWVNAPSQPYYPSAENLCTSGPERPLLELPMNTWHLQAPYDDAPRVRYMNPAVHPAIFANALRNWENTRNFSPTELSIWVMIFHPDEVLGTLGQDALYSRSREALCANLISFQESLQRTGRDFEWVTVNEAAERWRGHQQEPIA